MRDAWRGLKTLAGQTQPQAKDSVSRLFEQTDRAEQFYDFYCSFDRFDFTAELSQFLDRISQNIYTDVNDTEVEEITPKVVQRELKKLNIRKATGPDNLSGRVLKACSEQLSGVFSRLFNLSISSNTIPALWKKSIICPVPKRPNPVELNDFRPIVLTTIIMKCFERIMLHHLLKQTEGELDPLQFAYKRNRGV